MKMMIRSFGISILPILLIFTSLGVPMIAPRLVKKSPIDAQSQTISAIEADHLLAEAQNTIKHIKTKKDFRDAIAKLNRARRSYENAGNKYKDKRALTLNQLGKAYYLQGYLNEAHDYFKQALGITDVDETDRRGALFNNLGVVSDDLGNYREALDYYYQAFLIRRSLGNKMSYADTLMNIAIVLRHFGQPYEAFKYYEQVRPIYQEFGEQNGDWSALADLYHNIGNFYLDTDKPLDAIESFQQSVSLHRREKNKRGEAIASDSIGLAYHALDRYQDAIPYFQTAMHLYGDVNDKIGLSETAANLGALYEDMGLPERGLRACLKALDLANETRTLDDQGVAYYGLGRIYQKQKQFSRAYECYEKALSTVETIRATVLVPELLPTFSALKNPIYYGMVSLLAAEGREQDAFKLIEKFRARSLRDTLARARVELERALPVELRENKKHLEQRIFEVGRELAAIQNDSNDNPRPTKELKLLADERDKLAMDAIMLDRDIANHLSNFGVPGNTVETQTIQNSLQSDAALLEYILGEDVDPVLLAVVTRTTNHIIPLALNGRDAKKLVASYSAALWQGDERIFSESPKNDSLYELLVAPAMTDLNGIKRLVISPDSALHRLPFEALVQSSDGDRKFLIETYEISYAHSATVLANLTSKAPSGSTQADLLAFATPSSTSMIQNQDESRSPLDLFRTEIESRNFDLGPLPSSKEEVEAAASLASSHARLCIDEEATEKQLKALNLSDYRIIHFAVHATADDNPANCALLLRRSGRDDEEDGRVTLKELAELGMNADLVILSACDTARGFEMRGEGVESLAQAAIVSGARSVIASQWKVDDKATSEFMEEFYKHLAYGESKAAALRATKLEFLRTARLSHPRYWAAFVLIGDGDGKIAITPLRWWTSKKNLWSFSLILTAALICCLLLFLRRQSRNRMRLKSGR